MVIDRNCKLYSRYRVKRSKNYSRLETVLIERPYQGSLLNLTEIIEGGLILENHRLNRVSDMQICEVHLTAATGSCVFIAL